ncbi:MAG TPA: class I SAM-dependent methyltransferase [Phycisphaeraceae bacterium]
MNHVIPRRASDWQREHIDRLWTYWGSQPHHLRRYFTYQVGPGLVAFLKWTGRLRGRVLDYGCGPGFLLEYLLDEPVECCGLDASAEAIRTVEQKFAGRANWRGIVQADTPPVPYEDASFDVVTCLETLEHLPQELLAPVVGEVKRLLKPGGMAMFTTPFDEDLTQNMVYCPFCQSEFHSVQHLRSFDAASMRELLESQGLRVVFCRDLNFREFQRDTLPRWRDLSPRLAWRVLRSAANRAMDRLAPRPFPQTRAFSERLVPGPHLCAIAVR